MTLKKKSLILESKTKTYNIEGVLLHAIEKVERGQMPQQEVAEFAKCIIATIKRSIKKYSQHKEEV